MTDAAGKPERTPALSALSVLVIVVRGMEWFTPVGLLPTLHNASTLSALLHGDITPVATGARSLAMLEALVGQRYPAIIIARLVSLQGSAQ